MAANGDRRLATETSAAAVDGDGDLDDDGGDGAPLCGCGIGAATATRNGLLLRQWRRRIHSSLASSAPRSLPYVAFFCFSLVAAVAEDSASNGVVTAGDGAEDGGSRCFDASSFVLSSTLGHSKQADARSRRGDGRRNVCGAHSWLVTFGWPNLASGGRVLASQMGLGHPVGEAVG
uniref:Uncharacterized protein n=1 Tax=Oryza glumipatula TaxID=40148 RepID=A0A0E0ATD0_9ORYZ